ncbi:MAG: enoyl-CoA hydratase-related protein [Nitrospinota bacterium]
MATGEAVIYEIKDHIATITLNRPDKANAINRPMRKELGDAYNDVKYNPDVWVAILTANGKIFCAGKDLLEKLSEDDGKVLSNDDLYVLQRSIYKPIVCALNGPCFAQGAGATLNADIVIMSERASLGWPQVKRGISSVSGPSMLAQVIPWPQAMGYLMRGVPIPAADCLRLGLANEVVPHEQLLPVAERWAKEILENAPLAVRAIKESARRGQGQSSETRQFIARDVANRILSSEDSKEGILAFKEKRDPVWKGM